MDSQPTSSDAYTQRDTDKSGQQVGLERQGVVSEKMEDGANSLHEINVGASGNASKKTGSIKIKTSKELGSSVNHSTDPVPARTESPHKRESKMAGQDSRYNKQELDTALTLQESQARQKKVKAYESLQFENPMFLDLCGTLFPNNSKSICHSVLRSGGIPLPAAINMLMNYVCEVIARDFSIAYSSLTERKRMVVVLAYEGDPRASQRPVNLPMMQQQQQEVLNWPSQGASRNLVSIVFILT